MSSTDPLEVSGDQHRIEELCRLFEEAWTAGPVPPRLEDYLRGASASSKTALLHRLLTVELQQRRQRGEIPLPDEYHRRFSAHASLIRFAFQLHLVDEDPPTFLGEPQLQRAEAVFPPPRTDALFAEQGGPADEGVTAAPERYEVISPAEGASWRPQIPGYEILGELGQGGMGVVYHARQESLERPVAIKMVVGTAHTSTQLNRFRQEALAIARLRHPNIVEIYEIGCHQGQPFFVLEFVDGGTLRERIDHGRLRQREAIAIVEKVVRAIHYAHQNDIVHRDLKPGNILLTRDNEPKITDFGVAKVPHSEQTRTGAVLGTPEYMSPEQARGHANEVGPATDIYSLGVILFEVLTGHRPIEGVTQMDTIQRLLYSAPESLRRWLNDPAEAASITDLEAICQKCLEKEAPRRYRTAVDLAEDLHRWLENRPVRARPIGLLGRLLRFRRRQPLAAASLLLLGLLMFTLTIATPVLLLLYFQADRLRTAAENAERNARHQRDLARLQEGEARNQQQAASLQVARLYAATGVRHLDAGHNFRSLVWTSEALQRKTGLKVPDWVPCRTELLRLRIAAMLDDCPRLVQAIQTADWVDQIRLTPDGTCVQGCDLQRSRLTWWKLDGTGRSDPELPFTTAPRQEPTSFRFSSDGRQVLVQYRDGLLDLWDIPGRRSRSRLEAAPNGSRLQSWLEVVPDRRLYAVFRHREHFEGWLWCLETGRRLTREPLRFPAWERANVLEAGGGYFLTATPLLTRLHEAMSGEVVACSDPQRVARRGTVLPALWPATLSPDGAHLAGADKQQGVVLWDIKEQEPLPWSETPPLGAVRRVRFDSRGLRLLVLTEDIRVRVWSIGDRVEPACDWLAHGAGGRDGWFSPDERYLLTICDDGRARVWNLQSGLATTPPLRHSSPITAAAWTPDGRRVLTRARDGSLLVWDLVSLATPVRILLHDGPVQCVAFSPQGDRLLTGSADGTARLWDLASGRQATPPLRHAGPVTAVGWEAQGRRVTTLSERNVRVWETSAGKGLTPSFGESLGNRSGVALARFRPGADQLLVAYADRANLVELGTSLRDVLSIRHEDNTQIQHACYSPDGQWLATADDRQELRVWGPSSQQMHSMETLRGRLTDLVFVSPDQLALVGSFGLLIRDVRTQRDLLRLPEPAEEFRAAHLSADRRWLLTISLENTCRVWDIQRRQPLGPAFQPGAPLRLALPLASGTQVLTVLHSGEMRLWDSSTGEPLTPPVRLGTPIAAACLSPDETLVALAGQRGKAFLWKLPVRDVRPAERLRQLSCLLAGQRLDPLSETLIPLREEEWQQLWQEIPRVLPEEFTVPREKMLAWHEQQADVSQEARDWHALLFHLDQLAQLNPEQPELRARRATALQMLGRVPEALAELTRLLQQQPRESQYRDRRARVLMLAGRWREALEDVQQSLRRDSTNGSHWLRQFLLLERLNQPEAARAAYRKALEQGLDLTYRSYFLTRFYRDPEQIHERRKQWQPLREDLTILIDDFAMDPASKSWLSRLYRCRGLTEAVLGEWGRARQDLLKAAQLLAGETDPEIHRGLALAAVMLPELKEDPREHLKRAIETAPEDGSLWYLRSWVHLQRMDPLAQREDLDRAIQNGADHRESRLSRGRLLQQLGQHHEAVADFTTVLKNETTPRSEVWFLRGLSLAQLGHEQQACLDLGRAADLEPGRLTIVRLALLLSQLGQAEGKARDEERKRRVSGLLRVPPATLENNDVGLAEVIWTASLFPGPDRLLADWLPFLERVRLQSLTPQARSRILGAARYRLGQLQEAQALLEEACQADPDGGTALEWFFLALVQRDRKDYEKSREAQARAREWMKKQRASQLRNPDYQGPLSWPMRVELTILETEVRR